MLIDSFLFYNESELAELRIKYLDKIVDYFVVVEANITHQGKKKEWNFPKILETKLKKFSNKIEYHKVSIDPEKIKNEESWIIDDVKGDDAWRIENQGAGNTEMDAAPTFNAPATEDDDLPF